MVPLVNRDLTLKLKEEYKICKNLYTTVLVTLHKMHPLAIDANLILKGSFQDFYGSAAVYFW